MKTKSALLDTPGTLLVGCVAQIETLRQLARRRTCPVPLLEVRADLLACRDEEWLELCAELEDRGQPVLLTIRSHQEGGRWRGSEANRLRLYDRALPYVSAFDMEIHAAAFADFVQMIRPAGKYALGSFHDFQKTPPLKYLVAVADRGRQAGAHLVKLATRVNRPSDLAVLLLLLEHPRLRPLAAIGMGPAAAYARLALASAGSRLAYCTLDRQTAPGQLACAEMKKWLALCNPGEKS